MEREILFRGQLKDTKKWVYGCYLKERACDGVLHIIVDEDGEYYSINPKTLCQYVGLTDKNGRRIFEGDVVKHKDKIYEIRYFIPQARFLAILPNGVFNPAVFLNCEVIGNVPDNPELLKGEN